MLNRVIKMSKAGIAAIAVATLLTGCGGGSAGSSASASSAQSGAKTASLSWTAPATRVNGDGLKMGELKGYIIHYGQDPGDLSRTITINDASTMDYTVSNLSQGSWYFSIQVVDLNGLESAPSELVSKTI